ncbi:uncharacterized protein LOC127711823 [Mytilus californianus]|uniref:uncharacterized protein LOC127711823 n=1 Tax=Mytilus californianus TaxID=6549 RepID=UPI002248370E|nr:uncharacterized protein LOC127711823 [Mytilus californianus]
MICLIRNFTDLQISNKLPFSTQINVGDDLSRIHHYRNEIAHTNSFIIEDNDFNNYWEDIAQAVQRLGGSSFSGEIIALKEMPISESEKAEYLQFIRIQNRLTDVEEKLVEVTDKLSLIEAQQNDPLPKHIRDLFEKEIENWKKDDEKFFETTASRKILDVVKKNTFTIISGNSGMGKTAIAHHVALHLQEHEGYQILPISDPNDIDKYYSKENIQILVIDDLCGIYSVDQYLINLWDRVSNKIRIFIKDNEHFRILVTCRLQITKNPQFERLSTKLILKECSLLSKDFASTYVESQKIATFHMNQEHIDKLSRGIINGLDMFPFLCGMFGKSENKDFRMFECPIQYFKEQFDQMQYQNEGCFLGLALLVIYNDRINTNVFQDENTDTEFNKIFEEVFECLGLSNRPSKLHVLASLNTLIDTYTIRSFYDSTIITSKHGKIFELLALYFGKKMTNVVMKYASPGFIASRIQFESIHEEHDDFTIMIPLSSDHLYFSRMIMEINRKNFHYVFGNKQSHFKSYQEKFIIFFSRKEDIMKIMLQNKWPLYLSSLYGCCILIQFLLERKASDLHPNTGVTTTNTTNFCDESSFEISTEDMFIDFDYRVWNDCRIKQNNAPLVAACEEGYFEIVQTLVKYGYDIDFVNANLKSPLMTACYYEHTDIVKYLLDCNCKVDLEDNGGQTALHVACSEGNIEIVSLLLERGCKINKLDLLKQTPLILACKYANLDVVKILLKYDCEINACDKFSVIRLNEAVKTGHKDIMKVTITAKCDVNITDNNGRTALHEACFKEVVDDEDEPWSDEDEKDDILSNNNVVKHYIDTTKDECSDCNELIRKGIVELLLQNNVNIAIADWEGFTALHRAAESGYPTIVDILLNEMIETNQKSSLSAESPICLHEQITNSTNFCLR